jgi:hypothetical protein
MTTGMMDIRFTIKRLLRRGLYSRSILAAANIAVVAISGWLYDEQMRNPTEIGTY